MTKDIYAFPSSISPSNSLRIPSPLCLSPGLSSAPPRSLSSCPIPVPYTLSSRARVQPQPAGPTHKRERFRLKPGEYEAGVECARALREARARDPRGSHGAQPPALS